MTPLKLQTTDMLRRLLATINNEIAATPVSQREPLYRRRERIQNELDYRTRPDMKRSYGERIQR